MSKGRSQVGPPGSKWNAIDVDDVEGGLPVYGEGEVQGLPLDLTQGEDDVVCFVCISERYQGRLCSQIQPCCGAQCHTACFEPWLEQQQRAYADSVSCPCCRIVMIRE